MFSPSLLPLLLLSFPSEMSLLSWALSPPFPPLSHSLLCCSDLSHLHPPLTGAVSRVFGGVVGCFFLLLCFLRVDEVSNTKQYLWQFLATVPKNNACSCGLVWFNLLLRTLHPIRYGKKYGEMTTGLMGNNSRHYITNAPRSLHLELFTSGYRQVIYRAVTCLGLRLSQGCSCPLVPLGRLPCWACCSARGWVQSLVAALKGNFLG